MADYDLGTAKGKVVIESDTTGLDTANKKVEETKGKAESSAVSLGKIGKGMGVAGLALAAGLGVATQTAADFDQSLANISAVSGITGKGMDAVRAKALQLGKDTKFSAGEAAGAIEELSKAGLAMPDILNGAADATVALAAAGGIALPEAATIASNAMNQFSLKAADMPGVADAIAGAANASAIDVSEFGQSLQQVGAVANLAGVSFEDTATAIALMGNAGIKGSDAGTSLKSMFQRLIPNTKEQKELMAELGIITKDGSNQFFDASGKMKSLADVSQILQGSMKGMTAEQKQATLTTLFGSDAIRAAAVLSKEGAKGFDTMAASMKKVSAADVAATKMDTFNGSLEQMKGSLETAGIVVGTIFLPVVRQIVDTVTEWLNKFLALDEGTQRLIGYIAAGAAAFLLFGFGMVKVVGYAQNVIGALKTIGGMFSFLKAENLKAAAAWVAQTAKVALYQAQLLILRVQLAAMAVWQGIVTAAQWAWNAALSANPIGLIVLAIIALIAVVVLLWNKNEGFRKAVIAAWEWIQSAVKAVGDWFMNTLWPALQAVWDGIVAGVGAMVSLFVAYWTTVWNVVQTVWNAIKTVISTVLSVISTVISTYFNIYRTVITTIFNAVRAVVSAVWNGITAIIRGAVNLVKGYINGWVTIIKTVAGFFQRVKDAIVEKFNSAVAWVKGVGGKIISALGNVGSLLWNAGSKIIQGLLDGIKAKFEDVKNFVGGIASWIADHKGPISYDVKLLVPNGEAIMKGLREGIKRQMAPLTSDLALVGAAVSPAVTAGYGSAPINAAGTVNNNKTSSVINFNNYGNKSETASDANARQLRAARTVGMFG